MCGFWYFLLLGISPEEIYKWFQTMYIDAYDVYINNNYYGTDLGVIQVTLDDILRIEVVKNNDTLDGNILFENKLV
jgi:hypothetical protein